MDKRVEKNHQSVLALRSLLVEIASHPETCLDQNTIIVALKSQGALAKYSDESKGIIASSINTQKRVAESILEGGYDALNKLRMAAQMSIERKTSKNKVPDKETKSGLLLTIDKLEYEKQSIRNDLLLLTLAFEKSLRQGISYASKADATTQALCKKEQRELLDILILRKHSLITSVVKLHED